MADREDSYDTLPKSKAGTITGMMNEEDDHQDPIEERKEIIEELFERAEEYAKTNVELFKLKATDKLSQVISTTVSTVVLIVFFSFFFFMLNIGVAILIGEAIGNKYIGFFIIAGFYLLIALIIYFNRARMIKNPIVNSIISQVLK